MSDSLDHLKATRAAGSERGSSAAVDVHLGLGAVGRLELNDANHARLTQASANAGGGSPAWRHRKRREAHDLLALAQLASPGRMIVLELDLRQSLRALIRLRVPVACFLVAGGSDVVVASAAVLGLTYPEDALWRPQPGYAYLEVISPQRVCHPSVSNGPGPVQAICLGPTVSAGVRCVDLVLLAYGALQMSTVQVDERDPAGVMNVEAARFWQAHMDRLPLSRTAFLEAD